MRPGLSDGHCRTSPYESALESFDEMRQPSSSGSLAVAGTTHAAVPAPRRLSMTQ